MKNWMLRLWREEKGQDLTEYALLLVLLSLNSAILATVFRNSRARRRLRCQLRYEAEHAQ